ncbi:MAG: phosphoribosyltransferase family protein [Anaerolineae bacterium]|nr:phosphoribosyltransferase family protein [Anaerolineae bacterium]MDQ7034196.1 phosphoribosyltransferase family protein [Anaerolineae bacterium]
MSNYNKQTKELTQIIDAEFWKEPQGVAVDYDDLRFLYVPDHVATFIVAQMARKVYRYQVNNISTKEQITHAIMITMGGLLPGVMLHDHLAWTLNKNIPAIDFGTMGVKFYAGPGAPLDKPTIIRPLSIDVKDKIVGVVEDLVDLGGTAQFVAEYLAKEKGAKKIVLIAPYLKSTGVMETMEVLFYGHVPKDTWIITPREKVETLIKRVPYWRDNGASIQACEANLRKIGYPPYLTDVYLRPTYERG